MSERLEELARALGYAEGESGRLAQALTHKSHANEVGDVAHNERLEFLGDAIVGLVVAEALMEALPDEPEGTLSRLRAGIVNARSLAGLARRHGLGALIRLGRGEQRTGGREKDSLLADAYEAMVAAVYLDLGLERARALVRADAADRFMADGRGVDRDYKTLLQEWVQARAPEAPLYRVVDSAGPDHQKVFTVELALEAGGRELTARGTGRSKKEAERAAARQAWEWLTGEGKPPREPRPREMDATATADATEADVLPGSDRP